MAHIQEKWGVIRRVSGYWNPYSMTYQLRWEAKQNEDFGFLRLGSVVIEGKKIKDAKRL